MKRNFERSGVLILLLKLFNETEDYNHLSDDLTDCSFEQFNGKKPLNDSTPLVLTTYTL